ncbi:DUF4382 domain-containing protein [Flavihumibacter sp. CACIAM 22H1]|uniref:DUF4382 domain-containing protein n=1 Tax=Flavihumibacter sp. CACIAM 22H1 TaxID=1812911 RepID=UPI0007A80302|nr:DUF4382 domain-containing protein [Flavihumibacter sp. CACIAM 22H1]KYP15073.1 MAG: hypothetical protein A1D16_02475 [Flavihumibacter sp. CACIAM 22H1]
MKTTLFKTILMSTGMAIIFTACSQDDDANPNTAQLEIRLTDAPNPAIKEVWVDIKEIQLNMDGENENWTTLSGTFPGVYNLLDLTNGRDTILANATLPSGKMNQLRLLLGENNYIITADGQKEMLTTPSAQESGLKVLINADLTGGVLYRLVLDFDAAKSIVPAGNSGKYILKPVIRVLSMVPSGGIVKGFVAPDSILTTIFALKGSDTISTTATSNGNYQFRDIPAGNYSLHYYPAPDSFKTVQQEVTVTLGQTTMADTIHLELN